MKISIITPCYNSEKNISQMIESVLTQSYQNFELILIDDGSTDTTMRVIEYYKARDSRVRAHSQENSGKPSIARNAGIKRATGDIISFLDSDDTMLPNKLKCVAGQFTKHPNINIVVHDFLTIDRNDLVSSAGVVASKWGTRHVDDALEKYNEQYISRENVYEYFLSQWIFLHVNTVSFRKSAFTEAELLFDEQFLFAEDISKWCEMAVKEKFLYINKPLATYRDTPNSLMKDTLEADIASLKFVSSHLESPLVSLNKKTQVALRKKVVKETKDVIYQAARKRNMTTYFCFCGHLLAQQISIAHVVFIGKAFIGFFRNSL